MIRVAVPITDGQVPNHLGAAQRFLNCQPPCSRARITSLVDCQWSTNALSRDWEPGMALTSQPASSPEGGTTHRKCSRQPSNVTGDPKSLLH